MKYFIALLAFAMTLAVSADMRAVSSGVAAGVANINGGTIDNAVIGGTTPVAGTFTSITGTSNTVNSSIVYGIIINRSSGGAASGLQFKESGTAYWATGPDVGSVSTGGIGFYDAINNKTPFSIDPNSTTNSLHITTSGVSMIGTISTSGYTVGTLPTCNAGARGNRAYVTDASAPSWNATLSGGGAVVVPAFCNGSAWVAE